MNPLGAVLTGAALSFWRNTHAQTHLPLAPPPYQTVPVRRRGTDAGNGLLSHYPADPFSHPLPVPEDHGLRLPRLRGIPLLHPAAASGHSGSCTGKSRHCGSCAHLAGGCRHPHGVASALARQKQPGGKAPALGSLVFCCCSAWCGICPIWSSSCPPTSSRMRRSPSVRCSGARRNFPAFFRI